MKILNFKIYRFILDLLFPSRCALCDTVISYDECICKDCISKIEYHENYCKRCGFSECECDNNPNYDLALSLGVYDGVLKNGILRLKTEMSGEMCRFFADWVKAQKEIKTVDAVTFVPMTRQRLKVCGFNHSKALAQYVSRAIKKPLISDILVKTNDYTHHKLSEIERREQVKNAYDTVNEKDLLGKTVLLVDDIMTTGATLNKCAGLLKKSGAKSVICACVAKVDKKVILS